MRSRAALVSGVTEAAVGRTPALDGSQAEARRLNAVTMPAAATPRPRRRGAFRRSVVDTSLDGIRPFLTAIPFPTAPSAFKPRHRQ
jgi:hypothetical protein